MSELRELILGQFEPQPDAIMSLYTHIDLFLTNAQTL
jgi:hypothetical protein